MLRSFLELMAILPICNLKRFNFSFLFLRFQSEEISFAEQFKASMDGKQSISLEASIVCTHVEVVGAFVLLIRNRKFRVELEFLTKFDFQFTQPKQWTVDWSYKVWSWTLEKFIDSPKDLLHLLPCQLWLPQSKAFDDVNETKCYFHSYDNS